MALPLTTWLVPDAYYPAIEDVDFDALADRGFRGLIIDLDNTLVPWGRGRAELSEATEQMLTGLQQQGFALCLVSNALSNRELDASPGLDFPLIKQAGKPRRRSFYRAMDMLGTSADETAMIGDQLFTDVLGGNRAGLYTILVVPIDRREFVLTRLFRVIERAVLSHFQRSGLVEQP